MRHEDQGWPGIGPQIEQMALQIRSGEGIERRERLVEQQHVRSRHQRPRDGDALRLAARQVARPRRGLLSEADAGKRRADAFALGLAAIASPKPTLSAP